jgi:hypothetical protein
LKNESPFLTSRDLAMGNKYPVPRTTKQTQTGYWTVLLLRESAFFPAVAVPQEVQEQAANAAECLHPPPLV